MTSAPTASDGPPRIGFQPVNGVLDDPTTPAIDHVEAMLREWFGRPVVLLASGRTGLRMALAELGFARYKDLVRVPQFLSRCVLDTVTHQAFPIIDDQPASGTLFYHQYGFPQRDSPQGPVIEDLAHSFFASPSSGVRAERYGIAVFSLPKFFPTAGFSGGLLVTSEEEAERFRAKARATPTASAETRAWMRSVSQAVFRESPAYDRDASIWRDSAYSLLFQFALPDPEALSGVPASLEELKEVGAMRGEFARRFRERFDGPEIRRLWPTDATFVPFALPYFPLGGRPALARARSGLAALGVHSDVYRLDVARSMRSPLYRECLLVPGHQQIDAARFEEICARLADAA